MTITGNVAADLPSSATAGMAHDLGALGYIETMARAPLEMRAAETVDVKPAERLVTILAVPYDTPTPIYRQGEWITETVAPTAFHGVEHRTRQVKVNRGHDLERSTGIARKLDPYDKRGLIATLRISPTPLGDETLALCEDGVLDASVGFAPIPPDGEVWTQHRQARRIDRAHLGHIALVPNPAYNVAQVLDVRASAAPAPDAAPPGTPRLDEILARLAAMGYVPRPVDTD